MSENCVELKHITKAFGSVLANHDVSIDIKKGEILSLLGENGSGKTSLMNILAGIYFPDEGEVIINGEKVAIHSPADAFEHRIGMVHQHFKLIDTFSSVENVAVGLKGRLNLKETAQKIKDICDEFGFILDPNKKVYDMSVSEKQTLEIIKVLYRGVDILILDEPTAVLTPQETEKLFAVLRNMRAAGKSIIIITHKLNEVLEISDRVTILRKGEFIGTVNTKETSVEELTEMMVGKKTELNIETVETKDLRLALDVVNLNYTSSDGQQVLNHISFQAFGGEILGIAGISGNGQRELLEAIAGLYPSITGDIFYYRPKQNKPVSLIHKSLHEIKTLAGLEFFHDKDGKDVTFKGMSNKQITQMIKNNEVFFNDDEVHNLRHKDPLQIRELGIHLAFVPEDRLGMGLVGNMNIANNMLLRTYRHGKGGFIDRKEPTRVANKIVNELEVVTSGPNQEVKKLSGGNVQKVLIGREIEYAPSVFMVAYPVRGLDINSSYVVYNELNKQKSAGVSVIFVGEDLDVLMALCDRIMVLYDGKITGIVNPKEITKNQLGKLMVGQEL